MKKLAEILKMTESTSVEQIAKDLEAIGKDFGLQLRHLTGDAKGKEKLTKEIHDEVDVLLNKMKNFI